MEYIFPEQKMSRPSRVTDGTFFVPEFMFILFLYNLREIYYIAIRYMAYAPKVTLGHNMNCFLLVVV